MNVPQSPPTFSVSNGPDQVHRWMKDASLCILLAIALASVYWNSTPRLAESDLPPTDSRPVPVPTASNTTGRDKISESPSTEAAPNPESEMAADPSIEGTAPAQVKPDRTPLPPSAVAIGYIAAPEMEAVSTPENKVIIERARQDLQVAVAPSLPIERAERPVVIAERKVEFFSVQSKAQTVAFVVDCSSSMSGAPFERCRLELIRAIVSLQPDQAFYVIFFSGGPVPLPGADVDSPQLSQAKSWVKHQMGVRIGSVPIHLTGTNPDRALQIAASINPDVIYLLTDGEFNPVPAPSTIQDILKRKISVNTIAFMSETGAVYLESLASKTGGTYRFVPQESFDGLAGQLQRQVAGLLLAEARTADATDLNHIHSALVALSRKDYGSLRIGDINRSLVPWRKWFLDLIAQQWVSLPHRELVALYAKGTLDEKIAILRVVSKTQSELLIPECIAALSESDEEIRQAARDALKGVSGGYDWSPNPDLGDPAAMALEVTAWERWQRMRAMVILLSRGKVTELKAAALDNSVDRRWAAAIAMGRDQKAPPEWLIIPLTDADPLVREAAVKSLQVKSRQLKNGDLGPELKNQPGRYLIDDILDLLKSSDPMIASSAEQALIGLGTPDDSSAATNSGETEPDAKTDWQAWWIKRKDHQARKELELAKNMLDLKNPDLQEKGREAATKRLNQIISHYPGTPSAATAQRLLQK